MFRLGKAGIGVSLFFGVVLGVACDDSPSEPRSDGVATLTIRADLTGTAVALLVIEVRAADLSSPLAFPLEVVDSVAEGVLAIPAGSDRIITGRAYDIEGIETHRGETVLDIRDGLNATLHLRLDPLNGSVPIVVEIGSVRLLVSPADTGLIVGDTVRLAAVALDEEGDTVTEAQPVWASLDPSVATVSSSGLVSAKAPGSATIVATWAGVGGTSQITVALSAAAPTLEPVVTGLDRPVDLRAPSGETSRLYVVEKPGRIRIIEEGALVDGPFLDLTSIVRDEGERGLLSLAFHPSFDTNGWFYVIYTREPDGAVQLERYTVSSNPNLADVGSALPILSIPHEAATNHNGGQLQFGPDGYLYWSVGDGGAGQAANGQDTTVLLGKVLRLDVDGEAPYDVPADNPFVGVAGADEIWAYGLRNPWRMSFDPLTGDLYIADVGQNLYEEINVQPAGVDGGRNYGWNRMEGMHCFPADPCDTTGLTQPLVEYAHDPECSVTGGYVYRAPGLLLLQGHYLYADYCSGGVWSFRYEGSAAVQQTDWTESLSPGTQITSFGRDGAGELYLLTNGGAVHRIVPAS